MQNLVSVDATRARHLRRVLLFALHQLISTIGVIVLSGVLCFDVFALLHVANPLLNATRASWLLTEVPGFPVQILIGLLIGFLSAKVTRSRSLLLVWIVPLLFLCFGALIVVRSTPSILSYLFGSTCKPAEHCFDQLLFTLPFLASLGYTAGATLARSRSRHKNVGPVPTTGT